MATGYGATGDQISEVSLLAGQTAKWSAMFHALQTTMMLSWKKFTKSTSSQRRRSSLNGTKPIFPSFFQRFLLILQALNTTLDYIIVRAGSAGYSLPFRICENPNAPSNARAVQSASKNQFCYHIWAVCIMARRIGARIPRSLQHLGVDIPISRRVSVL